MKPTDGEALTSAAASHYHHPTMALVLKHNMPAIMLKLRMSSSRYRYPYIIRWGVFYVCGSQSKCPFQSKSYARNLGKVLLTTAFKTRIHYSDAVVNALGSCLPRTQDGQLQVKNSFAFARLRPQISRAQVQVPKEPLKISLQGSQGKRFSSLI